MKNRSTQISRIARKLARRDERKRAKDEKSWGGKPFRQKDYTLRRQLMIAYDLETTRFQANSTPAPLYITAYGESFRCSSRVQHFKHLSELVSARFLIPEHNKARFVAWNGNNFDVYLIARALLLCPEYILRPYLTRSKNLRGLKVIQREKWFNPAKGKEQILSWEFLDGISMTGLVGFSLKKFLAQFAPDYGKLEGPDFEAGEEFDWRNAQHVRYAERDSEGLYFGMKRYEDIVVEKFGLALQPTVGNLGIKLFQMNMPADTTVWKPSFGALDAIRNQVLRGGFCRHVRRFDGPIWKYDLNQAYAAAMRDARLPAGRCLWNPRVDWKPSNLKSPHGGVLNPYASVYIARIRGAHPQNRVPFYCRNMEGEACFAEKEIPETWITSIEHRQLLQEGACLEISEAYFWDEAFSMKAYVDRLEEGRMNAEGGPSGAIGTVFKNIGNHSYGKTVERLDGLELVMTPECPEGYSHYQSENDNLQCVWYKFVRPILRDYHQPQIGAFITAHVRMVLRRGILIAPDAWLMSDTDMNAFSRPVHQNGALPVDLKKYGFWKVEVEGDKEYLLIGPKVYASKDGSVRRAKGMNVKRLSMNDFINWHAGLPPTQVQVQRNNFVSFVAQGTMFKERKKVGERV